MQFDTSKILPFKKTWQLATLCARTGDQVVLIMETHSKSPTL